MSKEQLITDTDKDHGLVILRVYYVDFVRAWTNGRTDGRTDRWADATKLIISPAHSSQSITSNFSKLDEKVANPTTVFQVKPSSQIL